eukprot:CAMPEP_0181533066 /NCGR_PEP_ID=MMETSP1110-20121109/72956_1 /TAXON_ID=174948 /ORGANISM="Symbiodinium sp., Strain CCMP421" /LENGTH=42 /DNA_ID= /DNA_START= /DNA_END= /DNA_ORIENTATION=
MSSSPESFTRDLVATAAMCGLLHCRCREHHAASAMRGIVRAD